jgi:iron complex transport system substrate-binding protein
MTALLGDSNEIVAAPDASLNDSFKKVFPAYATANPKKLLSSKPDDVITSGAQVIYGPITDAAQIAQYKALGISVVSLNNFTTVAQLKDNIRKIAAILGGNAPATAETYCTYLDTNATYCNTKIGGLGKTKIMLVNSVAGVLSTVNSSDILSAYITTGGGINVAADLTTVTGITAAQIATLNPDVIITMNAASKTALMALAGLQNVPAIYNGKVYVIPSGTFLWSVPNAEDALMPLWLAKTMHGEYLGDLDMNKTVKDFYSKYYGYTSTDAEVTTILAGQ